MLFTIASVLTTWFLLGSISAFALGALIHATEELERQTLRHAVAQRRVSANF